jgi:hypothetical protein
VFGYSSVSEAKTVNNDVVDLDVNTTTESTAKESNGSDSEDLKNWAETETEFGKDLISNDVTVEGFFERVYNKFTSALNGLQIVVAVILVMFFAIETVMVVVSCLGQKNRVPWYLLALLITAMMFICDIYAFPIMNAFRTWFMN